MEKNLVTPLWQAILLPAVAGGMGWGIRGQYGHETGAMIAGVLVASTIAVLFLQQRSSLVAARFIALTAIGFSFGGSMTYGQTVGLTQNSEVIGNWTALSWGLLGLFIKGGIWIGLAGAFLGIGLSRQKYRPFESSLLLLAMMAAQILGVATLNRPYEPPEQIDVSNLQTLDGALPTIYFSEHPDWYPGKADLKPRREGWGGLLFAWFLLIAFASFIRREQDRSEHGDCRIHRRRVGVCWRPMCSGMERVESRVLFQWLVEKRQSVTSTGGI